VPPDALNEEPPGSVLPNDAFGDCFEQPNASRIERNAAHDAK
jgi:hypothetical protein